MLQTGGGDPIYSMVRLATDHAIVVDCHGHFGTVVEMLRLIEKHEDTDSESQPFTSHAADFAEPYRKGR